MLNHTIGAWRKYCLHFKDAVMTDEIEDTDAANKTENVVTTNETEDMATTDKTKETIDEPQTEDTVMADDTRTEAARTALPVSPESMFAKSEPSPAKTEMLLVKTETLLVKGELSLVNVELAPVKTELAFAEMVPALIKVEPLDLAFTADILSSWNPNEESGEVLWIRMETTLLKFIISKDEYTVMTVDCGENPSMNVWTVWRMLDPSSGLGVAKDVVLGLEGALD
ncbi:hypothetical protein BJ322DRAFT_1020094 [Thelephora terrestris]|uniref:Uncharacterized protein n=1 Tax=Thelephora terrestris TaxID=56493 RepID=A0A9P6HFT2_9AGAM|nr:hypothetical protein BJ322DRAFT_1020094 [Thelephora terrestris]